MVQDWKGQAQDYGKINFDLVLMNFIGDINKQLSKLPHEMVDKDIGITGTTHEDIINSYCDMVEHLEELLSPYHDDKYTSKLDEGDKFKRAKIRFGNLIKLCSRCNFLFTKIRVKASGEDG